MALAFFSTGLDSCDAMDMLDSGADASAACGSEECTDELVVEVIRSDNDAFLTGCYRFAFEDATGLYEIECYLAYAESGFECTLGDIDVITVMSDLAGTRIWLTALGAPEIVAVSVEYNGLLLGQREMMPSYEEVYPNGYECPPVCYAAEESMAVTPW